MQTTCPSCHRPIDQEETQQFVDGSGITQCSHCGLVLSENVETAAYSNTDSPSDNRIANFQLVRQIGHGGFGAVWLAHDRNLGRRVALKLPRQLGKDAKLRHEAQTAAKLRHPNIVSIYEVGLEDDQVFIASEYVDGQDLQSELANGRPEISTATRIVATIARAVQHAHEHGVVHRDLKPANIILNGEGEPFITDFGIAKHLSVEDTISTDGQVVGTVSYMSPEQARGSTRETDSRADIYALGVMLFELLTEYRPFRGNARAVIHQKIYEDPPSPRKLVPSLPRDLATICLKCLEREPAKRYATAAELADELERFDNSIPIQARPISRGEKLWRWCRRKPLVAGLLFSLLLSLSMGLVGTSFFWRRASHSSHELRHSLYRTHMNLASRLWERGDIAGLRQVLNQYADQQPSTELRGFEWHYYDRLLEPYQRIANYGDVINDVALSYDGQLFAAAGNDRAVRVWSATAGTLLRSLELPKRATAIAFSPIDERLVTATADGVVRLWNPRNHDRAITEFRHGPGLIAVAYSPDGRVVVSAGRNGKTRLWTISDGKQLAEIDGIRGEVQAVKFDRQGRLLAIAERSGKVHLWDIQQQQLARTLSTNSWPLSLAFVDDDAVLAVGMYGSSVQFWSVAEGARVTTARLNAAVGDLEYLASVDLLAAVTTGNKLTLLNRDRQATRSIVTHTLTHGMLARSQDERYLLAGSGDGSLKLLSVSALVRSDISWFDSHVRDLAYHDAQLLGCTGDGAVFLLGDKSDEPWQLVPGSGREMLALARHPDGDLLACSGMTRSIQIFDLRDKKLQATIDVSHSGFSTLDFSGDGQLLAAGSRSGSLHVYESGTWDTPFLTLDGSDVRITDLRFSPASGLLAVAYSDRSVHLLDPREGLSGRQIDLPAAPLALEFCRDGEILAIGTQAGEIHFYHLAAETVLQVIKAHSSRINALAVFPGGNRLISGGRDRELRIWDVDTGDLVTRLPGHGRQVFAISVAPDGQTVVSAGLAGDVRWWRR